MNKAENKIIEQVTESHQLNKQSYQLNEPQLIKKKYLWEKQQTTE